MRWNPARLVFICIGVPNYGLRDVIPISLSVLYGVRGREAISPFIVDEANKQAGIDRAYTVATRLIVGLKLSLDLVPQFVGNDSVMLAIVELPSMCNLAQIDPILQQLVKRAASSCMKRSGRSHSPKSQSTTVSPPTH